MSIGEQILSTALAEVGKGEDGRDNFGADVARYMSVVPNTHQGDAWCSTFVSYVVNQAAPQLIKPTAVGKGLMRQFQNHGAFHSSSDSYAPKDGDVVFLRRKNPDPKQPWQSHLAIIKKVDSDGTVHVIAGNSNDDDLGNVWSLKNQDKVREASYTKKELRGLLLGYGSIDELAQHKNYNFDVIVAKNDVNDREKLIKNSPHPLQNQTNNQSIVNLPATAEIGKDGNSLWNILKQTANLHPEQHINVAQAVQAVMKANHLLLPQYNR